MTGDITIREYCSADASYLLELFRKTVHRINCRDYNPIQIAAWAPDVIDAVAWTNRFEGRTALVAEIDGRLVGFIDMTPTGHIDRLFVSADRQRAGIGRRLLSELLTRCQELQLGRLTVDASITARPFFESHEFIVLAEQTVEVRGVKFVNYRMERLESTQPFTPKSRE